MAGTDLATTGPGKITVEGARTIFRNFSGKEGKYNREGDRNFVLLIDDPQQAIQMSNDGWNVKYLQSREEGEEPQPYIQVSVEYRKGRPPRIVILTSKGQLTLPEELVEMIDWADIANVDLIVTPYQWSVNGKSGIKAYLHALYVTIREDELELKYADVPQIEMPDGAMGALIQAPLELEAGDDPNIVDAEIVED